MENNLSARVKYYSAMIKMDNLPFATAWTDLEDIMLSEISQVQGDEYEILYISTYLRYLKESSSWRKNIE